MKRFKMRIRHAWTAVVIAVIVFASGSLVYLFWLPDVSYLRIENPKTTAYMQIFVRKTLAKKKKPIVMMHWTRLEDISPHLRHAVIIAEDDMFYVHHGVDWDALRQALHYDLKKGKLARGGSTITQQVARNLFLSPSRNPLRKLKEMLIAWKLERALRKDRILEIYLNIAEWGVGIYGAQAACQIYFGKNAMEVTPDESVALAAALPSPWRLNPSKPEKPWLVRRKDVILERMRRAGYLAPEIQESDIELPDGIDLSTDTVIPVPASTLP